MIAALVVVAPPAQAAACTPYSPLDCSEIGVGLPFAIDWSDPQSGVADSTGAGSGFTMIQPNTAGTQYKPSLVTVVGGDLDFTTTAGIAYTNNNTQDNALGVGVDATGKTLQLTTQLVDPPATNFTNKAEQAGLWFGPDQDNYTKLVVAAASTVGQVKIQLLRERLGVSTSGGGDEVNSPNLTLPSGSTISLALKVDSVAKVATATYQIGASPSVTLAPLDLPANFFDGSLLVSPPPGVTDFGGIFTTHRNRTTGAIPFTFHGFGIDEIDGTAPAAPTAVDAAPGDSSASVTWDASASTDTVGYNVYRSLTTPVPLTTPINGSSLITDTSWDDVGIYNDATYHYAVVAKDGAGNSSSGSTEATATPTGVPGASVGHFIFTTAGNGLAGYVVDTGQAYDSGRGYGWVDVATGDPADLTKNTRLRTRGLVEPRSNRLVHMQYGDVTGALAANGYLPDAAWEYDIADGSYRVTVAVGDQQGGTSYDSDHSIRVEGVNAIDRFKGTPAQEDFEASVTVDVSDGQLTIDPVGGFNTKLHFVDIVELPDTTAPDAPTGLAATVLADHVQLDWVASSAGDVDHYEVFRSQVSPVDVSGAPYGSVPAAGVTFDDNSVTPDTTYYYAVVAVDTSNNASDASEEATADVPAAPDTTAPEVPAGLAAVAGDHQVDLSWDAVADADGDLAGYRVFRSESSPVDVLTATQVSGPDLVVGTALLDATALNGTMYYYVVVSEDETGNASAASEEASATPTAAPDTTAPDAPTGLAATVLADHVQLDWVASSAGDVDHYEVFRSQVSPVDVSGAPYGSVPAAGVTFDDNSVTPDTTYYYAVVAVDTSNNASDASEEATADVPAAPDTTAPEVPAGLAAVAGDHQVDLSWDAVADADGDLAGYRVFRSESSPVDVLTATQVSGPDLVVGTALLDATALNGTMYYYVVVSEDETGNASAASEEASATPTAAPDTTAPDAPTGLAATVLADHVQLDWVASSAGDVDHYEVFRSQVSPVDVSGAPYGSVPAAGVTFDDNSVTPDTTYYYAVVAVDTSNNASDASEEATADVPAAPDTTAPEVPAGLAAVAGDHQVDLSWDAVADADGDLAGYRVFRSESSPVDVLTATQVSGPDLVVGTALLDATALNGTMYYYVVVSEDETGNASAASEEASATPTAAPDTTAPDAPTGLAATVLADHVQLDWVASSAGDVDHYEVFRSQVSPVDVSGAPYGSVPAAGVTFDDNSVTPDTTYYYAVVAVDTSNNASDASEEATADVPAAPTCSATQWTAEYYDGTDLAGPLVSTACDDAINKFWADLDGPFAQGVGADDFSIRWTKTSVYAAGNYVVQARSDDGIRVFVDGTQRIDDWSDHGADNLNEAPVALSAGAHTIVVEYYERGGSALAQVSVVAAPDTVTCTSTQYRAEYFDNKTLTGTPANVVCEDAIDHLWPDGVGPTGVGDNNFSVRWTATQALPAATYRLQARSDDGIRVMVDGSTLIDQWYDHGADDLYSVDSALAAGEHTIVVEYYEAGGSALAQFSLSPVTPTVSCPANEWEGQYYPNMTLNGTPVVERCDAAVDFLWPDGASPDATIPDDHFSTRWTRTDSFTAGTYRVDARSDDGIRVRVDGGLVIDEFTDHGADDLYSVDIALAAGEHTIVVEYYENGGSALAFVSVTKLADDVTCDPNQYRAEYYDNQNFAGSPVRYACEDTIDYLWPEGVGPAGVGDDHFSIRWTTTPTLAGGSYYLQARSDDGIRVLIDGNVRMSQFFDHGADDLYTLTTAISAGTHTIVVEYYENGGSALANFSYSQVGDTTPPPVPGNLIATPGNAQVALTWDPSVAPDLAGYRVYRATTPSVPTGGSPISGASLLGSAAFTDTTALNDTTYYYSVTAVDGSGNASLGSTPASATPTAPALFSAKYEFQPAASPVPAGYLVDTGAAYSAAAGRGWVTEATVGSASPTPLDLTLNTRDRGRAAIDPRQDSLIHMQYGTSTNPNAATGVLTSGAWILSVPNGTYDVTVSVGDQGGGTNGYDSQHTIRAEGVTLINQFQGTAAVEYQVVTGTVVVSDGALTIDAIGGTNTKLNYLEIAGSAPDETPPAAPTSVSALPGDGTVSLSWGAGPAGDAVSWDVYRSTTTPVATSGSPANPSPLTAPSFADSGLVNGTTYYYVAVAVDAAGNRSAASAPVSAVPAVGNALAVKVNFSDLATAPPTGYVRDFGEAFAPRTGAEQGTGLTYGWLDLATGDPLSLVGNGRNRNTGTPPANEADTRLATLVHAQLPANATTGVHTPGKWELALPNGIYTVTVSVGDSSNTDSSHWVEIEDQNAIAAFAPDATTKHASATRTVAVSDGRLTLTPIAGTNTKFEYVDVASVVGAASSPRVQTSNPGDLATGVAVTTSVVDDLVLPNGGVDGATLNSSSVKLTNIATGVAVPANVLTSGGGDTINLSPANSLSANTTYRFDVTAAVHDVSGAAFLPYSIVFTTGAGTGGGGPATFTKVASGASGKSFASVVKGPDGKLYASTLDGYIYRYDIKADGTLQNPQIISTVRSHASAAGLYGAPNRSIIGLTFDPSSTAGDLKLWITDNPEFTGALNIPDFTSQLAYLTGPNLETYNWVLTNLPRSVKDHETNSIAFGPDGLLYFNQGANNAMGAADSTWGNRAEAMLSAAVLRLDPAALPATLPLDVRTVDAGGTYNPFTPGAPLIVYASGTRNAYDLVWHRNGHLYVPTNGSAAGGNTPATPATLPSYCSTSRLDLATAGAYTGPTVPAITNNSQSQTDFVYDVKQGKYYGHPNPARCEWVLDNGNPTAASDPFQVNAYPVGTLPDRNYDLSGTYDAGLHASADGVIEYIGGELDGKLLVVRYSDGQDIETFDVAANGTLSNRTPGSAIPGFSGFSQPLDLTEDVATGNLYVTQLGAGNIMLLRPQGAAGSAPAIETTDRLLFNDVSGGAASAAQSVVVRNTGSAPLTIPAGGLTLVNDASDATYGGNAGQFQLVSTPTLPTTVAVGASLNVQVAFNPTSTGPKGALLRVASNDTTAPLSDTVLRGLGTIGIGGSNEPSLQWILDTYQIQVNVGDPNPADYLLGSGSAPLGEEVIVSGFTKAESDTPVTVQPIAVFGPQGPGGDPNVVRINAHDASSPFAQVQQILRVPNASYQTLNPAPADVTDFDPPAPFGLDFVWPALGHTTYAEDARNTWESDSAAQHKVRVYPLKDANGVLVPDAYIVAPEDVAAPGVDYQDAVLILRNVTPLQAQNDAVLDVQNLDGLPYDDRLVFNRIQTPDTSTGTTQRVKDTASLRIANTGTDPMQITALTVSGPFSVSPVTLPATVPAGGNLDVTVNFTATSGDVRTGSLTVGSTAGVGQSKVVDLAGFWQSVSEGGQEPSLHELTQVFGWTTSIPTDLNQRGAVVAAGDEVLSPYWRRLSTSSPVSVRELAGFHTFPNGATAYWTETSGTQHNVFGMNGAYAQSILPTISGSTTTPAAATFTPTTTTFGFKVDGESSDDTKNTQTVDQANGCVGACGHHVRFWPLKDRAGQLVPGAYVMGMDYAGINYDYQDNVYLITNIQPAAPSAPANVATTVSSNRVKVTWSANPESGIAGYRVYRSETSPVSTTGNGIGGAALLPLTNYVDTDVVNGTTYYYAVTAAYTTGEVSKASLEAAATPLPAGAFSAKINFQPNASTTPAGYTKDIGSSYTTARGFGWVAPGSSTPIDMTLSTRDRGANADARLSTLILMQGNGGATQPNVGAWEIAVPNGSYTVTLAAGDSAFTDSTHSITVEGSPALTNFVPSAGELYRMATVNVGVTDGRLTVRATGTNTKIAYIDIGGDVVDTTPPSDPTGLSATGAAGGITLDWNDVSATDLDGYFVYRASSAGGPFTRITGSLVGSSTFVDAGAPTGVASFYRVSALDTSGNESGFATTSATRPGTLSTVFINTGGAAQSVSGTAWSACTTVANCGGWVTGGNAYSESDTITGIPPGMNNTIFQSEWTGGGSTAVGQKIFGFAVPVAPGTYTVRLHFAELNKFAANERLFDVQLEGSTVLSNFDVWTEAGGADKAIVREFTVPISDGVVNIDFLKRVENAKISAIEIVPGG